MKKLFGLIVIMVALSFMATNAEAITARAYTIDVGYSQAKFVVDIDSSSADTLADKTILFIGTSSALTSMTRLDSLGAGTTYPDTIEIANGGLEEGVTYYWYMTVEDTSETIYVPFDYQTAPKSFTTTSLTHTNSVVSDGYSTAWIEVTYDTTGVGDIIDSIRLDLDKTVGTTYSDSSITSVTYPDTVKYTGLDEGVTYYYRTVVFLTDSLVADTTAVGTFTTTDLTVDLTALPLFLDSIGVIVDTSAIILDSIQFQYGAGSVSANSVSLTTVTGVDTFYVLNMFKGGVYSYRALAFLADSGAVVETTTTSTYSMPENKFLSAGTVLWPDNYQLMPEWDFDNTGDQYSTGALPIESDYIRIHATIDGADQAHTFDSIQVFIWSWEYGDSTIIDTLFAMTADTATTSLILRMTPNTDYSDSSLALYPPYTWGSHYGLTAVMKDSTSAYDIGTRSVHLAIEKIE